MVIEVKGRPGNWHPHIHALTYCRFLDWERLLALWRKVSSGQSVYITRVRKDTHVRYLTKYLTKPDVPDDVIPDINAGIKGTRWLQPFGACFAISQTWEVEPAHCPDCGEPAMYADISKTSTDTALWLDYVFRRKNYAYLSYKQTDDDTAFAFGANLRDAVTADLLDYRLDTPPF